MNFLKNLFLSAAALAVLAGCSDSGTDEPGKTTDLSVPEPAVTVSGNQATVRWLAVENAHHYAWELLKAEEATPSTGNVYSGAYSFSMEENTVYRFRVQAVALPGSAYSDSEWSEYVTASSNMLATPVAKLDESSLTDVSAKVVWAEVEDADAYRYELSTRESVVETVTVETAGVSLADLTEGTAYRFRVMALTSSELKSDSPWSEYLNFTTRKHELLAAPVATVGDLSTQGATVRWNAVSGAVKYAYELFEGTSVEGSAVKSDEVAGTEVTFSDLREGTSYTFRVKAVADAADVYSGDSEFSEAVGFRTRLLSGMDLGLPEWEQDGVIRAFPGAEGAGMFTTGGRGGKVYHVTTLDDDRNNRGSLRWIVQYCNEPRIVVFDVAGTIRLKSDLKVNYGNITILGQTAPGDGICIRDKQFSISANNVIIRYLRFRPGDRQSEVEGTDGKAVDGLDAIGSRGWKDIIIDHCSMSWSSDECASFYVVKNMTMQWCMMYESLRNGNHGKGSHGYGGIWGGAPATFHHNILAHHDSRNPRLEGPERYGDSVDPDANAVTNGINTTDRLLDFRNNVVYNFCNFGAYGGVGITMNFVGNYYKWGPASYRGCGPTSTGGANAPKKRKEFFMADNYYDGNGLKENGLYVQGNPSIYLGGNSNVLDTSVSDASIGQSITADNTKGMAKSSGISPYITFQFNWADRNYPVVVDGKTCSVTTHSADDAFDRMVQYCGASHRMDAADSRVLADVKNGTGTSGENLSGNKSWYGIIDSPDDKGGYPVLTATDEEIARAATDTDGDGIPDYYEDLLGLDRNDASDAAQKTLDPQGLYTNFEIYAHYLVKDIVSAQNSGGNYAPVE